MNKQEKYTLLHLLNPLFHLAWRLRIVSGKERKYISGLIPCVYELATSWGLGSDSHSYTIAHTYLILIFLKLTPHAFWCVLLWFSFKHNCFYTNDNLEKKEKMCSGQSHTLLLLTVNFGQIELKICVNSTLAGLHFQLLRDCLLFCCCGNIVEVWSQ